ncbi:MAG: fumarylacetoacetate hydrolase family protein [Pseudomonadota bacterium]
MKLASLKKGGRDGSLIVVDRRLEKAVEVRHIAPTLQQALEQWSEVSAALESVYRSVNHDELDSFPLDTRMLASPLPRAYQWLDGSAYLNHVERVRKARGAEIPPALFTDPLMYQGGSDGFLGPNDPIHTASEQWGVDFEAEVAVVTDDVPLGVSFTEAAPHIKLLTLVNDVSLRNLIPPELAKGFGFVQGKPPSAFSPVAVTPDELGDAWDGGKVHLPLITHWNGKLFGKPDAGADMHFDFPRLISHAAMTRSLSAGTIVGSGTVSNQDRTKGCSCIVEKRVLEILENGSADTSFMAYGDRVRIEMLDRQGMSIFGAIEQELMPCPT